MFTQPLATSAPWLALVAFALALASPVASQPQRRYLYVGIPGAHNDTSPAGVSLLVFDAERDHQFVKRIPIRSVDASTESVRGLIAAPTATIAGQAFPGGPRLYVSTTRRLAAVDAASGRVIWEHDYGGQCCERMAVSPDGRTIYAPAFGRPVWYVIEAKTGTLVSTVAVTGWPRSTSYARDGSRVFLSAWESNTLSVVETTSNAITREVGPFSGSLCPFTTNRRATMAFANIDGLVGFEVGDLQTGLLLDRVQVDGYGPEQLQEFECPSHGIAFTPDEKELWVADGIGNRLRVFDATPYPPVETTSVQLARQPRWITFGVDGRFAYSSTGDVVDVASKQIVTTLKDENGRVVESERMVEVSLTSQPASVGR